jgi:hypothetical protein
LSLREQIEVDDPVSPDLSASQFSILLANALAMVETSGATAELTGDGRRRRLEIFGIADSTPPHD